MPSQPLPSPGPSRTGKNLGGDREPLLAQGLVLRVKTESTKDTPRPSPRLSSPVPGGHLVAELIRGGVALQVAVEHIQGEETPQVPPGDALSAAHGAGVPDGERGVHGREEDVTQLLLLPNLVVWGEGVRERGVGSPPAPPGTALSVSRRRCM